jgi:lipoteichoic acid synthase
MFPMFLTKKHRQIFFAGLLIAYLAVLYNAAGLGHESILKSLARIVLPCVELGFFYLLCSLLIDTKSGKFGALRALCYPTLTLLVAAVYTAQTYSLYLSGNFITVLALENTGESRIIRNTSLYAAVLIAAIWWLISLIGYVSSRRSQLGLASTHIPRDQSINYRLIAMLIFFLALLGLYRAQKDTGLLEVNYRQTPVVSFVHTVARLVASEYEPERDFGPSASKLTPKDKEFPLQKTWIYRDALPFQTKSTGGEMNVIVIFTEGTSARLLGSYGGKYPDLTPNIDRLAARSMRVINYYNHTAATYRGLQGQLVSGYPWAGGESDENLGSTDKSENPLAGVSYRSVPMILNNRNYHTYFLSPHHDTVGLNTLLRSLGFDKVFSFDDVSHDIAPGNPFYFVEGALSDGDLFKALRILMSKNIITSPAHPFFIGLYNFGTHSFLDVIAGGVKYGDGSNPVLNRLHNYDYELGKFMDWFFASDYAKNTMIIFTSDHADFPDQPYRAVAGDHYKPVFVDRIPLLIYDPNHDLPKLYDARGRTSIDLAPTLLQLIGIAKADNSFLGTSLFEPNPDPIGFTAIGNEFYATDADGVYPESSVPIKYKKSFADYKRRVEDYYQLEKVNRVFNTHP